MSVSSYYDISISQIQIFDTSYDKMDVDLHVHECDTEKENIGACAVASKIANTSITNTKIYLTLSVIYKLLLFFFFSNEALVVESS